MIITFKVLGDVFLKQLICLRNELVAQLMAVVEAPAGSVKRNTTTGSEISANGLFF